MGKFAWMRHRLDLGGRSEPRFACDFSKVGMDLLGVSADRPLNHDHTKVSPDTFV